MEYMFERLIFIALFIVGVPLIPAAYASMDYHSLSSPVVQEKVVVIPDRDGYMADGTKHQTQKYRPPRRYSAEALHYGCGPRQKLREAHRNNPYFNS